MSSQPKQLTRMTPKMPVPRPGLPWRRIWLIFICICAVAALSSVIIFYQSHAMPNVSVAGEPVSSKSLTVVEAIAQKKASELQFTFKNDTKTVTPSLEDIGVGIDVSATARAALAARRGGDMLGDIQVWRMSDVPLVTRINEAKLSGYLAKQFPSTFRLPMQPDLKYNPGVEQFDVIPGKSGAGFDTELIAFEITNKASRPGNITFNATSEPVEPSVTDTTAVHTQDEANRRLRLRLDFLHQDKLVYFPEAPEIAGWLDFRPSNDGLRLDIVYDKNKIVAFIKTRVTNSLNTFFGPNADDAAASNEPLEIAKPDALAEDIIAALRAGEPTEKEVEVLSVGAKPGEVVP